MYAGRARKSCSCQFPHIGSFDLFRPNEAFYNMLTSAYNTDLEADRDIIIDIWYSCKTSQGPI